MASIEASLTNRCEFQDPVCHTIHVLAASTCAQGRLKPRQQDKVCTATVFITRDLGESITPTCVCVDTSIALHYHLSPFDISEREGGREGEGEGEGAIEGGYI